MQSVAEASSIIYFIAGWLSNQCRSCAQFVDVAVIPPNGDALFEWENYCPECMTRRPAAKGAPGLNRCYLKARLVRLDVGLGQSAPGSNVREVLGGALESPTLFMTKWHLPPSSNGRRRDGPKAPYLEEYSILGFMGPHERRAYESRNRVSPFPSYRVDLRDDIAPGFAMATVQLAVIVKHPQVTTAEMRFYWNPLVKPPRYDLTIPGNYVTTASQLRFLTSTGFKLLDERGTNLGGRPEGPKHSQQKYERRMMQLSEKFERRPKLAEFLGNFYSDDDAGEELPPSLDKKTLNKALKHYGWTGYLDFAEDVLSRSPSRK